MVGLPEVRARLGYSLEVMLGGLGEAEGVHGFGCTGQV